MTRAIAAALYFDHELAADPAPLATLLEALMPDAHNFRHWHIHVENRRTPPASALNRARLVTRVTRGNSYGVGIETARDAALADYLQMTVTTTPVAKRPERFSLTRCRYHAIVGLGPNRLGGLDAIIAFADAVAARAGAIVVAKNALDAFALAANGWMPHSEEINRVNNSWWQPRWGDVIRGPGWGTFLGAHHVDRLGGMARIERESGCARVIALGSGGAYLQVTPEPTDEVPEELVQFLEPVRQPAPLPP